MDAVRLGRQLLALRQRRGWRQYDLAAAARVPRGVISAIENNRCARVALEDLDRVASALDARLDLRLSWHGERLDRLLDAAHALLVEDLVRRLTHAGWLCETEVTFEIRGERGSIDVLAWHPVRRLLLVVEVKSAFGDLQATLMTLDRKTRLAPLIARRFGWPVQGHGTPARRRRREHESSRHRAARGDLCVGLPRSRSGGAALAPRAVCCCLGAPLLVTCRPGRR